MCRRQSGAGPCAFTAKGPGNGTLSVRGPTTGPPVRRRPTTHPPWEGPSDHHPGGGAAPSTLDVRNPGHLGLSVGLSYGISMEDVQVRMYDSRGTRRAIYCDRARSAREEKLRQFGAVRRPCQQLSDHPPTLLARCPTTTARRPRASLVRPPTTHGEPARIRLPGPSAVRAHGPGHPTLLCCM